MFQIVVFCHRLESYNNLNTLTTTVLSTTNKFQLLANELGSDLNTKNEDNRIKIKFTDLNNDVLTLIFERLKVKDLLNVSEAIPRHSPISADVLLRRKVKVTNSHVNFEIFAPILAEKPFKETFKIRDFELLLKTLMHFGGVIHRVAIQYDHISNTTAAAISTKYVNKYTGRSLTQLRLDALHTNILQLFTVPFEAVESLHLGIETPVNRHETLALNEIFPHLKSLNLTLRTKVDISLIECEFPQLEHLKLYMSKIAAEQKNQIFGLMEKNSHIKGIEIEFYPGTSERFDLERMNQLLPNLEHLTLHQFDIGNDAIHFAHVRRLRWERVTTDSIQLLSFSHLESLKINEYYQEDFHEWEAFLGKNGNLSRLHVTTVDETSCEHLVELTGKLQKLTKLTIIQFGKIDVDAIGRIMHAREKLNEFVIWTNSFIKYQAKSLREQFGSEWHIEDTKFMSWNGVSIRRKI